MNILKNTDNNLVEVLANHMFLSGDLEKWYVIKSRNPQYHVKTGKSEQKMMRRNNTMKGNPNWTTLDETDSGSDSDDEEITNVMDAKESMAHGGVSIPYTDICNLLEFAVKTKIKLSASMPAMTENILRAQATREANRVIHARQEPKGVWEK